MEVIVLLNDRMTKGIIAGVIGAIVQNIYAYLAIILGLIKSGYIDVSRSTLFINNYRELYATVVGLVGHFAIDIIGGVIFAYLIKSTSSRYFVLKGISFGIMMC